MTEKISGNTFTSSNQTEVNAGFIEGVLNILPTTKGADIMIDDSNLLWLLNQFDGKKVQITISEIVETSTYQSSNQTPKKGVRNE